MHEIPYVPPLYAEEAGIVICEMNVFNEEKHEVTFFSIYSSITSSETSIIYAYYIMVSRNKRSMP